MHSLPHDHALRSTVGRICRALVPVVVAVHPTALVAPAAAAARAAEEPGEAGFKCTFYENVCVMSCKLHGCRGWAAHHALCAAASAHTARKMCSAEQCARTIHDQARSRTKTRRPPSGLLDARPWQSRSSCERVAGPVWAQRRR